MGLLSDAIERILGGDDEGEDFDLLGGGVGNPWPGQAGIFDAGLTGADVGGPFSELEEGSMNDILFPGWDDDFTY